MKKLFSQLNRAEINIPVTILWFALAVVYIGGLFVPLFDDDSAHHAAIALEMYNRGDWACLMDHENTPYLDKPHFQFWLVALSFQLFGVGGFAYKLSSFLFTLLGVWATYRLALHLCGRKAALYAALILASSAAFVLANIDVRMDAILTACIALAVWQGVMHLDTGKVRYLLGAALGMAMAFGTKGWIGVMVPTLPGSGSGAGSSPGGSSCSWRHSPSLSALCSVPTICSLMPILNWQCGGRPASPVSVLSCGGKSLTAWEVRSGPPGRTTPSSSSTPCCGRSCRGVSCSMSCW